MNPFKIREITPDDNQALHALIHSTLEEFNVPEKGSARADTAIAHMYETYAIPRAYYMVAEEEGKIIGGAGIAPLRDGGAGICELQKMYMLPNVRGRGLGNILLKKCLEKAREFKYTGCYLETMPNMKTAQALYKKYGFQYLTAPLGCTGHHACPVWMFKAL